MPKKLIFTEKQEKDIIDNYLISRNSRSVANLFDISQTTVLKILKKNKIDTTDSRTYIIDALLESQIIELYTKTGKTSTVSKTLNLSDYIVSKTLTKNKIELERKTCENEIIKFYLEPNSLSETSRKFGLSKFIIQKILDKNHINNHNQETMKRLLSRIHELPKNKICFTKSQINKIISLYEKPSTILDIANKYKVSWNVINNVLKTNRIKFHDKNISQSIKQNKIKQSTIYKYGVENYSKTKDFKIKVYNTKRHNNSFNISKPEEDYYNYLLDKFGKEDVVRQYKDPRYPFACDFYIKSKDLFIELNLHWTHGNHPFDETNKEDLHKLKIWTEKAKTSKYYKNAITVWTEKDVEKQRIAKENNLNYLTIFQRSQIFHYN